MPLAAMYAGSPACYDLEVFQHLLSHQVKRAFRYAEFFSLLLLSVDDPAAHGAGKDDPLREPLLRLTAENVRQEVRDTDLIGRYGSQLGLLLLHSPAKETRLTADRVRERIVQFQFPSEVMGGRSRVTVSLGGACFPTDGRDLSSLLERAFLALRRAREAGGDRAVMFHDLNGGDLGGPPPLRV